MAVRKRNTSIGQTAEYHYEFMQSGKRYYGVCEKCTTEREAEVYEKNIKATIKKLAEQKNVKTLVENFRDELTGGDNITIAQGYDVSLKKPRRRHPSPRRAILKVAHWRDFTAFMKATYPDIEFLSQVSRAHAEAYIAYIRSNGRYDKSISYKRGKTRIRRHSEDTLSNATLIEYQMTLAEVFTILREDAGIIENPFAMIPRLARKPETREAFTKEELQTISERFDAFTRPLFTIAIATALREGDICTLEWSEIDFKSSVIIRRKMRKTGYSVEIPIMPPLMAYLGELRAAVDQRLPDEYSLYVLPEHAKMYLSNPSGISYRIKQFLEKTCEITTTRLPEGRSRAISVKDLHSCRHTFCYYAGVYGIPLNIVQSIVGHMTPEMTSHYSAHATREAKRQKMSMMPDLLFGGLTVPAKPTPLLSGAAEPEREELHKLTESLTIDEIKKVLVFIKKLHAL